MVASRYRTFQWICLSTAVGISLLFYAAVGPSLVTVQEDILRTATDCDKAGGDCSSKAAQYTGISTSLNALVSLALATPYGILSDRLGRRPVVMLSTIGFTLPVPFLLLKPSKFNVALFYVMSFAAGLLPSSSQLMNTIMSDVAPAGGKLEKFGNIAAAVMLFFAFGSAVGSAIVPFVGKQGMLWGCCFINIFVAVVIAVTLPETLPGKDGTPYDVDVDDEAEITPKKYSKSKSVAQILFAGKHADAVTRWQCSFYWLYVFSALPEAGFVSILAFFIKSRFGYGPQALGLVLAIGGVSCFLWQTVGLSLLKRFCPNEGRMFQVSTLVNLIHFMPYIFFTSGWAPFVGASMSGASFLAPVVLRAVISDVTDSENQGRLMGILQACTGICAVVGPGFCGSVFALGTSVGLPQLPFLLVAFGFLPLSICIASFTLLPHCMPPVLQAIKMANQPLIRVSTDSQQGQRIQGVHPRDEYEAWERKNPPFGAGVKYGAPLLFIGSAVITGINEQQFACKTRIFWESKDAVKVIAGLDPSEGDGRLVLFKGSLKPGSIINQSLPDLSPYFALPPDFESPSLSVEVQVKQCIQAPMSKYVVWWTSSFTDSSKFDHDPKHGDFEKACGADNYWDPFLPDSGKFGSDAGQVGPFEVVWKDWIKKEINVDFVLENNSIITDKGREEEFNSGPPSCDPGFSFCQDWQGNRSKNGIGEARISLKTFDWSTPIFTVLGQNNNGVISTWNFPHTYMCAALIGESDLGTIWSGRHSVEDMFADLKSARTLKLWLYRVLGFLLGGIASCIVVRPLNMVQDLFACSVMTGAHLRLTDGFLMNFFTAAAGSLLGVGLSMWVGGSIWAFTWPVMGSSLMLCASIIGLSFLYIKQKHATFKVGC